MTTLPYPPSINHYWRNFRGRMVISREGRAYRKDVQALLAPAGAGGKPPGDTRLALAMDAFPPDRRRRDLDNIQKPLLDALEHAGMYEDDSQIDVLLTQRRDVTPGGQVIVRIAPLPLGLCLLCGAPMYASDRNRTINLN